MFGHLLLQNSITQNVVGLKQHLFAHEAVDFLGLSEDSLSPLHGIGRGGIRRCRRIRLPGGGGVGAGCQQGAQRGLGPSLSGLFLWLDGLPTARQLGSQGQDHPRG